MGSSFQFFDIIFFALIAAFVILRLRSVLGKRTGHDQRDSDSYQTEQSRSRPANDDVLDEDEEEDNVVRMPGRNGQTIEGDTPLGAGLTQIQVADPGFDPADFVAKANSAFEYIVATFAAGDADKLKPLLSKDVFAGFESAINDRAEKEHVLETELVRIKEAEFLEANMSGRTASIKIKYTTEQINVTLDEDGEVIDGDPDRIAEVVDIWTYGRDTQSSNPNWVLVATETLQ